MHLRGHGLAATIMNFIKSLFGASPSGGVVRHRVYTQIRYQSELQPIVAMTAAKNVPLILNFSAPWCATCTEMSPVILRILHQVEGRLDYVDVKADEPEMADELLKYGVRTFPTLVAVRREFLEDTLQVRSGMSKLQCCREQTIGRSLCVVVLID